MTRFIVLAAMVALVVVLERAGVKPVHACVRVLDLEPAELVFAGRITSWEPAPDVETGPSGMVPIMVPIRVHVTVTSTFKGGAPEQVTFVDRWSRIKWDGEERWGNPTDCPPNFPADPAEKWALLALTRNPKGELETLWVGYLGDSLEGERYKQAVALVAARLPGGGGPPGVGGELALTPWLLIVAGSALAAGSFLTLYVPLRRGTGRGSGGA